MCCINMPLRHQRNKELKSYQWFLDRIGKVIYRDYYKCCNHCDGVFKNGLVVIDTSHADYLYCIQNEYANEGIFLNYRDKK